MLYITTFEVLALCIPTRSQSTNVCHGLSENHNSPQRLSFLSYKLLPSHKYLMEISRPGPKQGQRKCYTVKAACTLDQYSGAFALGSYVVAQNGLKSVVSIWVYESEHEDFFFFFYISNCGALILCWVRYLPDSLVVHKEFSCAINLHAQHLLLKF